MREALRLLAEADPDMARALVRAQSSGGGRSSSAPETPKLSSQLSTLDAEQADELIQACDEALDAPTDSEARKVMEQADGELAQLMADNSAYRRKDFKHSVRAARGWLIARHGEDAGDAEDDRAAV